MTVEAAQFVREWNGQASDEKKVAALRVAISSLAALVKQAAAGLGVDRHLYALYCLWQTSAEPGETPPSIFADAGWAALNNTQISTSNCGNPVLRLFGFGPVVADGFGIGYIIKERGISVCAASKHRQTERFLRTLSATFAEMLAALDRTEADKRALSDHIKRTAKESTSNYGFFDAGDASEEVKPVRPRHGRPLKSTKEGAK